MKRRKTLKSIAGVRCIQKEDFNVVAQTFTRRGIFDEGRKQKTHYHDAKNQKGPDERMEKRASGTE